MLWLQARSRHKTLLPDRFFVKTTVARPGGFFHGGLARENGRDGNLNDPARPNRTASKRRHGPQCGEVRPP